MTDESNIGVWLGLICVALALLPWIPMDIWLHRHHHEFITTEVREALQSSGPIGMVICFVVGGLLAVALYHFGYQRSIT